MRSIILVILIFFSFNCLLWSQTAVKPFIGDGSSSDPFEISTLDNLYWIAVSGTVDGLTQAQRWALSYVQTSDIDASDTSNWFPDGNGGCLGWTPIGSISPKFSGSYNGQGHIISNLYINRVSTSNIGLFGYTENSSIKNLGLTNVEITGYKQTGALVGYNTSTPVTDCYSTGNVTGDQNVGGLLGYVNDSTIDNCSSSGTVTGSNWGVGGLIGHVRYTSIVDCHSESTVSNTNHYTGGLFGQAVGVTVDTCYATGNVSTTQWRSGGLAGIICATCFVSNSFSTGDVSGYQNVGGLIGQQDGSVEKSFSTGNVFGVTNSGGFTGSNTGIISNSYSLGNVTRQSGTNASFGGFTGFNNGGTIEYCYSIGSVYYTGATDPGNKGFIGGQSGANIYTSNFFDYEASNQSTDAAGGAVPKTTAEMKTQATFTGADWDFTGVWSIDDAEQDPINNGYPYLQWELTGEDTPLPIELSYFSAQITSDIAVNLEWRAETETDMLGYNILRSETNNGGGAIKINPFLITAHNVSSAVNYSFLDVEVINGQFYFYWLEALEYDLTSHLYGPVSLLVDYEEEPGTTPTLLTTELIGAYPNPFNPATAIRFSISEQTEVTIAVYNILGQRVQTIVSEQLYLEGHHSVVWQGEDSTGKKAASGVYFYKMRTSDGFGKVKKLLMLQ
jgi:hypothetical protein